MKNKHMSQNCGLKKIVFCGPEETEATLASAFQKGNEGLRKGGFRTDPSEQGPSSVFYQHKCKGKDQQGRGKGGAYPQTGFSASEISVEEGQGHPWESDDWAIPLVQLAEALLRGIIQDVRLG